MAAATQYLGHQSKQSAWFIGITWEKMTSEVDTNHLHLHPRFTAVVHITATYLLYKFPGPPVT